MVISFNIGADSSILFDLLFLILFYFIPNFFILRLITLFQALFLPFIMRLFLLFTMLRNPKPFLVLFTFANSRRHLVNRPWTIKGDDILWETPYHHGFLIRPHYPSRRAAL